jgi:cytidylate kinase
LQKQGANVTLSNLSDNLHERDARDTERHVAPTKPVADAIVIDSTNLSVDEVMQRVMVLADEKLVKSEELRSCFAREVKNEK